MALKDERVETATVTTLKMKLNPTYDLEIGPGTPKLVHTLSTDSLTKLLSCKVSLI